MGGVYQLSQRSQFPGHPNDGDDVPCAIVVAHHQVWGGHFVKQTVVEGRMVERSWQFSRKNSHHFVGVRLLMPDNHALVEAIPPNATPDE
jgi:hypothetical protein